ncbi:Rv3654c family TadE-like protein [Angustibacter sp. McL0619]|uniref:Rv3654c family TadE-like protein n=1 Tax=Angustibacter sp. McL0619 TaxID=3415676 RepID=UPI003CED8CF7
MAEQSSDRGTATAELAVVMPAVVLAMTSVIAVGQAVLGQLACVDAARGGARAAARGDDEARVQQIARDAAAAPSAVVSISRGAQVRVQVSRSIRLLGVGPSLTARAQAVSEPERPGEVGSATVLVLAAALLSLVLAIAVGAVGAAVLARHRAQAVADLSALTASGAASSTGSRAACAAAQRVAAANRAALVGCDLSGDRVQVWVTVRASGGAARLGVARATALAGPPDQGSR